MTNTKDDAAIRALFDAFACALHDKNAAGEIFGVSWMIVVAP